MAATTCNKTEINKITSSMPKLHHSKVILLNFSKFLTVNELSIIKEYWIEEIFVKLLISRRIKINDRETEVMIHRINKEPNGIPLGKNNKIFCVTNI